MSGTAKETAARFSVDDRGSSGESLSRTGDLNSTRTTSSTGDNDSSRLPQTGEDRGGTLAVLGLALMGLSGLAIYSKRKAS